MITQIWSKLHLSLTLLIFLADQIVNYLPQCFLMYLGGWKTWGRSLILLLSDRLIRRLRGCWKQSICNHLFFKIETLATQRRPICPKTVGWVFLPILSVLSLKCKESCQLRNVLHRKYLDLLLFLTSGGGGLETTDTTTATADCGVAHSG